MFNPYWKRLYWHESNIENNHKKKRELKICYFFYDSNLVMISLGLSSVWYMCVCECVSVVCLCLCLSVLLLVLLMLLLPSLLLLSQCLILLWYMWLLFTSFGVFHVSSARVRAIHHSVYMDAVGKSLLFSFVCQLCMFFSFLSFYRVLCMFFFLHLLFTFAVVYFPCSKDGVYVLRLVVDGRLVVTAKENACTTNARHRHTYRIRFKSDNIY